MSKRIYHIVHADNLPSIYADGFLYADSYIKSIGKSIQNVGMSKIKQRRLNLNLSSYPETCVGDCVPFYFCPRSIMLYLLYRGNHSELDYTDGQNAMVHLVADLEETVQWADDNHLKWVFTDSNASSRYFEDYNDLKELDKIDWDAVKTTDWRDLAIKEKKQAEFLIEECFPWHLVKGIGVHPSMDIEMIKDLVQGSVQVKSFSSWYY